MPFFIPWIFPKRIWRYPSHEVFITFDDGPHEHVTPWLIEYAEQEGIKLNFFWLGELVEKHQELLELAKDHGHLVGNHGYRHLNARKISPEEVYNNFSKGKELVPDNFYRPPYGKLPLRSAKRILKESPIVMWSWLSNDWIVNLSDEYIVDRMRKEVKAGDILVFHENKLTADRIEKLFPAVIEILKEKNLNPTLLVK